MAAGGNSSVKQQRSSKGFRRVLASAVLEWLLIFFLFINAIFSYLITRFARYCELQTPCLLCSRLDHVLGNKKSKSYWHLFCDSHKLEISSLAFCHAHKKLVDVCGMCENCLFSFATVNKSNSETYRLLVGKLWEKSSSFGFDEDPLPRAHHSNQSSLKHCSCCNEPWILKGSAQKFIHSKSFGSETSELDLPSSDAGEHNLHLLKRRNEKRQVQFTAPHVKSSGLDPLSHVGYTELKITSDSESEVLLSDDDDANAVICKTNGLKDDLTHRSLQFEPHIVTLSHDSVLEKLIDPVSAPEPLLPVPDVQSDIIVSHYGTSIASTAAVGNGLEELNWQQVDFKADSSAPAELISLLDVPPSLNARETLVDVTKETKLISLNEVPLLSNAETPVVVSEQSELNYHEVPPSSVSREPLVDITKESKPIFHDEVHLSSNAETPIDLSEDSKLISVSDILSSSNGRDIPSEVSKDNTVIFLDDLQPLSNAAESLADVSEERKLISCNDIPSKLRDTPEVSRDSKDVLLDIVPPLTNATESPVHLSEDIRLISMNDIPSNDRDTPSKLSKEGEAVLLDAVPPLSNSSEFPVDVSEECKLTSVDDITSNGSGTPEVSEDSKVILLDEISRLTNTTVSPVDVSVKSTLISENDVPSSSNGRDTPEVSKDRKPILLDEVPPLSSNTESPFEAPKESCVSRSDEIKTSVAECEEVCKAGSDTNTSNEAVMERNPVLSDTGLQASNLLDLSDAYKVAVSNRGRQLSGLLAEQWIGKDSSRLSEDLKLLLSQLSATRGFEQLVSDMSPKVSLNGDDSSSNGMQILQKRFSLERNESGFESLDGSSVSEIEGESVVDRLKRQVEHDKKLLSALYKELEEERNASAVAANQSMAMITRLQEEKASLHMEALQNLRMMEEQAEYDMEALQKTNDLLAEKEKEIQDLEEELEFYRKKFPNVSMLENIFEPTRDCKEREIRVDNSEDIHSEERAPALKNSVIKTLETDMSSTAAVKALLEFGDEKSYILESLKKLEKKLYMFSYNGLCSDLVNCEYFENGVKVTNSKDINCEGDPQTNRGTEVNDLSMLNDSSASRGSPPACGETSSLEKPQLTTKENSEISCSGQSSPVLCRETDLASLANEVSDLNERLEALEADQNFLELTIKSLKNGEEGISFVREIASHLGELRRIGIRRDETFA